jgi:hypothetical protein
MNYSRQDVVVAAGRSGMHLRPRCNTRRRALNLSGVHSILLSLVLPLAVVWIPVSRQTGLGTVTLLDIVLCLLWLTTLFRLRCVSVSYRPYKLAAGIVMSAVLPAAFAMAGALLFNNRLDVAIDLMQQLKRFGMPSIIPLALLVAPRECASRMRIILIGSVALMVLLAATPWVGLLPINAEATDLPSADPRAMGSLSNPNDYSYIGIFGALTGLSFGADRTIRRLSRYIWCTLALVVGLTALVTSASRSGIVAAVLGSTYITFTSRQSPKGKALLLLGLCIIAVVSWQSLPTFQDRMQRVISQTAADDSFSARIEAQEVALRTWIDHPLGVGFSNMYAATQRNASDSRLVVGVATSDNIYVDFLLGAGLFGLGCLILCLRCCLALVRQPSQRSGAIYLRTGILCAVVFGLATVSPASYVVAPFFFTLVGIGAFVTQTTLCPRYVFSRVRTSRQLVTRGDGPENARYLLPRIIGDHI